MDNTKNHETPVIKKPWEIPTIIEISKSEILGAGGLAGESMQTQS